MNKKTKKLVVLVQPGDQIMKPRPPGNLLPLAFMLKKAGFKPKIVDLRLKGFEKFDIDWSKVLLVGLTTYTGQMILQALDVAKKTRKINKTIPIVWGGIHPSMSPEQTAKHHLVDFVIKREGEETIVELAQAIQQNKPTNTIKGLTYKNKKDIMISTPNREWFDLNKIPIQPYELLDMKKYNLSNFQLLSSRGCPYECIFCYNQIYNEKSFRAKSAKSTVDEIEYVVKKYDVNTFSFNDDNFFTNKLRVEQICKEIIKRKIKIKWASTIRADYLAKYNDKFMQLIKNSGCYMLCFGAESGSNRILKIINKNITVQDIIDSVKVLKKFDIVGRISFIWGVPTETFQESTQSLNLIKELEKINPKIVVNGFFPTTAYPKTQLVKKIKEILPNFNLPQSLEEWGNCKFFTLGTKQPWLSKKYVNRMIIASEIIRFNCLKKFESNYYFKNKLVLFSITVATTIMSISANIRWNYHFYDFGFEWLIFNKLKMRFLGFV